MGKGGGGKQQQQAQQAVQVKYKKEDPRDEVMGKSRRTIGARYMQTRRATPVGSGGFGGQKQTLG